MSTKRAIAMGFRGSIVCLAALGAGITGCATAGGAAGDRALGVTMAQGEPGPSVVAGEARVVGDHVNPRFPVEVGVDGGSVTVRFHHARSGGALVRVDPVSLAPVAEEEDALATTTPAPGEARRVTLDGGRFVACWKSGDPERGYRVMAQAWTAEGAPLGSPVALSPIDADVLGAPQLVAIDGAHAVVTFVTQDWGRADVRAVPIALPL